MQWYNHRLVTATCVYAATGSLLPTLFACQGSIFPDSIEGHNYDSAWKKKHRTKSHYWPFYLVPVALCAFYLKTMVLPWSVNEWLVWFQNDSFNCIVSGVIYAVMWGSIGALCHIAEDFFCGGVPLINPNERVGVRLFKVATPQEYRISFGLMIFFMAIAFFRFHY